MDQIKQQLLEHDIRPTSQRLTIARLLLAKPQHLCADEVLKRVNQQTNLVSKATVYNTLNLFVEKELIREVIIDSGRVFYDSNTWAHHHIYNEDTGQLHDIDTSEVQLGDMPRLPSGTIGMGVDVIIRVRNKR
ncbi:MAG: transcriptional repressor [Gammaproteobacteria bacterium]|nr:transcriptional repressor [Gammaproteobacteria bacterium]NIN62242.1 transcriptional repressor [Gammaproteobacteria bacterium]NIO62253.1 transcriptional repressor [Gammaproteobacteria bacterium]NIP48772.1 transcriptional repressor [Gammaproteobacteria bacterium]NIQ09226.1 transcriptional repressor [Gammaproteobacteria bacterium]